MGHVAAALKRSHQWCVFLTPKNTKNIQRMTGHCFREQLGETLRVTSKNGCSMKNKARKAKLNMNKRI